VNSPSLARPPARRLLGWLDTAIFAFLVLFAAALPHSIKGAERAWKIALVLWLIKLAVGRMRPFWQPLAAPLLAYAVLTAISTALSPEPGLSWDRVKIACLYLAGIVVAQNLKRLSQVRWLVLVFLFSGLVAAAFTGWQYTYGIGVRLVALPESSHLYQQGIHPNDIITQINGWSVHTAEQLREEVARVPADSAITVKVIRFFDVRPTVVTVTSQDFSNAGLGTNAMQLERGKPYRAQGTLGHYVVFAEMLMQIGCLAWALLLVTDLRQKGRWIAFGSVFLAVTAALLMTGTRAAIAGLVVGCLLSLLMLRRGVLRWAAVGALIGVLAGATAWIQHSRGVSWVDHSDISTQFRVLMWQDGLRLVKEHPWFGVGMETVRLHWMEWNIRGFIQYHVMSHFHSTYLQIAVERGIPALLAWLWFCGVYLVFLVRLLARVGPKDRFTAGIVSGIFAGFSAFALTGFFHYNLGEESLAMTIFFFYGLAIAIDRITSNDEGSAVRAVRR
jgi:O-antigen ligase